MEKSNFKQLTREDILNMNDIDLDRYVKEKRRDKKYPENITMIAIQINPDWRRIYGNENPRYKIEREKGETQEKTAKKLTHYMNIKEWLASKDVYKVFYYNNNFYIGLEQENYYLEEAMAEKGMRFKHEFVRAVNSISIVPFTDNGDNFTDAYLYSYIQRIAMTKEEYFKI